MQNLLRDESHTSRDVVACIIGTIREARLEEAQLHAAFATKPLLSAFAGRLHMVTA